jgi:DNA-binding transcriptional regulator GbsR (MarR family)
MSKAPKLTASELDLVEGLARFYEAQGAPRIGGRVLGLLMIVDQPLSLDGLATTLKASRASISTNVRQLETAGMIEHHTFAGDRRDYYRFSDKAWEQRIKTGLTALRSFREIAERGLANLPNDNATARARLDEMRAFCVLFEELEDVALKRWRKTTAKRAPRGS